MNKILLISVLSLFSFLGFGQTVTMQVSGNVNQILTQQPLADKKIMLFVHPFDAQSHPVYYSDSVHTDSAGFYNFTFQLPADPASQVVMKVGTYDCSMMWVHKTFDNVSGQNSFTADFELCTDSVVQISECNSSVFQESKQDLTVNWLALGPNTPAVYTWDLGDGTSLTGQEVVHTYPLPMVYTVGLQTVTADSCIFYTLFTLDLTDNSMGCESTFVPFPTNDPLTLDFEASTQSPYPGVFNWSFGDGSAGNGQLVQHTYTSFGTYMVVLTTTDSTGCTSVYAQSVTLSDTINPPGDCENEILVTGIQELTVGFSGVILNQIGAEYLWQFGDGLSASGQQVVHTYSQPGIYTVLLHTILPNNCEDTSVYLLMLPDTNSAGCQSWFTYTPAENPFEIHFNGYTNSPYPTEFNWTFYDPTAGTANSSNEQNPVFTFNSTGVYSVMLYTIDSTGCSFVYSADVEITITGCDNNIYSQGDHNLAMYFFGNLKYSGYDAIYEWDLGDGAKRSGQTFVYEYAAPGTYTVTLKSTSLNDSCIAYSQVTFTLIDSLPNGCNAHFTAIAGNNLNEIQFYGYNESQYPVTWQWDFGDLAAVATNTSTLQNPTHIFSAAGAYQVVLTTTDSSGCTSTFTAPVVLSMFNTYNLRGRVFAEAEPTTACTVQLFAQDNTGAMNLIYETTPDSANYFRFDSVSSGIYHLLAVPETGTATGSQYLPTYFGDAFLWENSVPVVLGELANPYDIHLVRYDSLGGGDGKITGGLIGAGKSVNPGNQEILILDQSGKPVKFIYSLTDGSFSFGELPYGEYWVYPVITGIHTVPVSVLLSESHKTATVFMKISGQSVAGKIESSLAELIENLYPNPATDQLAVTIKSKGSFRLQILDSEGKLVFNEDESAEEDNITLRVPIEELKPGIYLLLLQSDEGYYSTRQFVKQ